MHKGSFQPASKKLFKKEREIQLLRHKQRIRNMSAHIDTSKPHSYEIPAFNMKKLQQIEERQTEIERENQALLQKITSIMNADRGIQQKNNQVRFQKTGINEVKRKNELLKITMENQHILKRIKDKKSAYDAKQLANEYQKHKYYKRNLCEYPVVLDEFHNSDHNQSKYGTNEKVYTEGSEYQGQEVNTSMKQLSNNKKNIKYDKNTILQPVEIKQGEVRTLTKKSKKIGINLYIIEITISEGIFKITADDVENPLTRVLEMHEEDGYKLINSFFGGSVDNLIDNLRIHDKITIKGLEKYQQQESPQKSDYQQSPQYKYSNNKNRSPQVQRNQIHQSMHQQRHTTNLVKNQNQQNQKITQNSYHKQQQQRNQNLGTKYRSVSTNQHHHNQNQQIYQQDNKNQQQITNKSSQSNQISDDQNTKNSNSRIENIQTDQLNEKQNQQQNSISHNSGNIIHNKNNDEIDEDYNNYQEFEDNISSDKKQIQEEKQEKIIDKIEDLNDQQISDNNKSQQNNSKQLEEDYINESFDNEKQSINKSLSNSIQKENRSIDKQNQNNQQEQQKGNEEEEYDFDEEFI